MNDGAWGYLVSVVLVGAVLWPLQGPRNDDSFPLSSYPMFTEKRPAIADIDHVIAFSADGRHSVLPPEMFGTTEVHQARAQLEGTIRRGRQATDDLCRALAARVAADADFAWAERLEVRSDSYQVAGYFSSKREPIMRRLRAACAVPR